MFGKVKYKTLHCLARTFGFGLGQKQATMALLSPEQYVICPFKIVIITERLVLFYFLQNKQTFIQGTVTLSKRNQVLFKPRPPWHKLSNMDTLFYPSKVENTGLVLDNFLESLDFLETEIWQQSSSCSKVLI